MEDTATHTSKWKEDIIDLKNKSLAHKNQEKLVAFYGSSTLRMWKTMKEDLSPLNTINLAFGGSMYTDCTHFFHDVFSPLNPEMIVLYAGDNDLANGKSTVEILRDLQALVLCIEAQFPAIKLAVVSIKPSPARVGLLPEIIDANGMIKAFVERRGNLYINAYQAMINDKGLPKHNLFLDDDLHLNSLGYDVWAAVLRKHLVR